MGNRRASRLERREGGDGRVYRRLAVFLASAVLAGGKRPPEQGKEAAGLALGPGKARAIHTG